MCGILGGNLFINEKSIKEAQEEILHRGSDAVGAISVDGFWMAHNRLSIQDLTANAAQPMWDYNHQVCIVFNGELWKNTMKKFNRPLRREYNFRTKKSDTEVFLYAYMKYGTEVFKDIDGMFSAVIYDKRDGNRNAKVIMVRDWVGRMPFYYIHQYGRLAFASEQKALIRSFNNIPKEHRQIVQPSHYYEYNPRTGDLQSHRYFNIEENIPTSDEKLTVVTKKIRKLLKQAVDNELIADVPVCTILSGGIDSVLITYLLKQKVKDLRAYVVNLGESTGKDDLHYARVAAEWMDIPLTEIKITKSQVEFKLSESIYAAEMDHWTQITPAVAQLFLAEKIKEDGYKVVFGGEGADELFGSYGNIQKQYFKQDTNKKARIGLIKSLHKNNLIRTNKAMMNGGTVELRTPFLDKEFAKYALSVITIDAKHHKHTNGFTDINWKNKSHMKYPLRKAFAGLIKTKGMPEELLFRKKETFQVGCHTDYLRDEQERMTKIYRRRFKLPPIKKDKTKNMKSNILLKDKADLNGIEKYFSEDVHVLGAMSKPYFPLDDIQILSTKFSKVGKTTIEKYPNLKAVIIRGHGHDLVNKQVLDDKGIKVYKLNQYTESCAQWCVDKVKGDKVLVLGSKGNIGSEVNRLLLEAGKTSVTDYNADTIISCIPYDNHKYKSNENFFNKEFFGKFNQPVMFISISRSPTHNNLDLYNLFCDESIYEAHIDTVASVNRDKLLSLDNFHYYEHTSWKHKPMPQRDFAKLLVDTVELAKKETL